MVEATWGVASFSSMSPVVDVYVPRVSVSPCSAELLHIVCRRIVMERPEYSPTRRGWGSGLKEREHP